MKARKEDFAFLPPGLERRKVNRQSPPPPLRTDASPSISGRAGDRRGGGRLDWQPGGRMMGTLRVCSLLTNIDEIICSPIIFRVLHELKLNASVAMSEGVYIVYY